ncbi:AMP-binding protein [Roseomonas sp. CCTCC AB2023176]|uniref:AMP-binding protein n=1 Tax=Roseomonas sp. CCTCC AB2023176 TaxID=3342640 RepID=UPI0035DA1518
MTAVLPPGADYAAVVGAFTWDIPRRCNIAWDACDRWADGSGRPAILHLREDGRTETLTFDALRATSARLAAVLRARGVARGDRVAVLLPQGPEAAIAHLAAYRMGAVAVPLFQLFGADALAYRLRDSGAAAIVTDPVGLSKVAEIRDALPALRTVLSAGGGADALDLHEELARAADDTPIVPTAPDDPALIIYTSGTTGAPKGALHGHRVLRGHLPGVEMPQEGFPAPGDLFWTPADWAWIGGLLDVLLPSLFHGVPVLSLRMAKFDPEACLTLMARQGVTRAFLPPTALKMLRAVPDPARFGARPRSIGSGGESLGAELLDWGRGAFGVTINEFYGQTECNLVVSARHGLFRTPPGCMGRAVPGHRVAVVGPDGVERSPGEVGGIAIRGPDPVMFLGYWSKPEDTAAKFAGGWLMTGDQGRMDEEGNLAFLGRNDDVITSAGYRIGPAEVEDCLLRHPAVALAAVVGVPDPLRTERVTAVVVAKPGVSVGPSLAAEIQAHVKARLAGHLYPREVRFVDALPMTATGKVMRGAIRASLAREAASAPG